VREREREREREAMVVLPSKYSCQILVDAVVMKSEQVFL
jgi:hypothetical protein